MSLGKIAYGEDFMEDNKHAELTNLDHTNGIIIMESESRIAAFFKNPKNVEAAYQDLLKRNYKKEDINLVMSKDAHRQLLSIKNNNLQDNNGNLDNISLRGLGTGSIIGSSVGALAAALSTLGGPVTIPALGIIVSSALAGAGVGAAAGSSIGALLGLNYTDAQNSVLEKELKKGSVIIEIKAKSEADRKEIRRKWLELQQNDHLT